MDLQIPGLLIHCSSFGINAECVLPVNEKEIKITRWFWTNKNAMQAASMEMDKLITSASEVIDEDIQICEQVFANLESGFAESGPLSQANEPGTIFFRSWSKRFLNRHGDRISTPPTAERELMHPSYLEAQHLLI